MTPADVYANHFERILATAGRVVDGLDADDLAWRSDPGANSIAWLVWHVARIQDDHVADVADTDQVWTTGDWAVRFGLDDGAMDTGWGHTSEQVATIRPSGPGLLVDYLSQVTEQTLAFLDGVAAGDLDRVVDESWDPPVTLGVRLNSVVGDNWQHLGQAAHVRGQRERT